MECSFVNEGEELTLLILEVEFIVAAKSLFIGCMVLEGILFVNCASDFECSVNILTARIQGVLGNRVANVLPITRFESGGKNRFATRICRVRIVRIVYILGPRIERDLVWLLF